MTQIIKHTHRDRMKDTQTVRLSRPHVTLTARRTHRLSIRRANSETDKHIGSARSVRYTRSCASPPVSQRSRQAGRQGGNIILPWNFYFVGF